LYIKKLGQSKSVNNLLEEFEGTVQGHRDGHGFVVRDNGEPDVYLPPNEMRAVLHKDRVKVRIVRSDRRGRPEGRVVEILERPTQPIIGRLLQESGVWLVAPEDKRYGQDVLIPKGATGMAKPGQVVVVELTEPPALFGQPVGRITEVLGEVDDPGMEIEIAVRKYGVPHEFSEPAWPRPRPCPTRCGLLTRAHRPDGRARWSPSMAKMRATSTMRSIASRPASGAARVGACWWPSPT
jgi:ribonuclease R